MGGENARPNSTAYWIDAKNPAASTGHLTNRRVSDRERSVFWRIQNGGFGARNKSSRFHFAGDGRQAVLAAPSSRTGTCPRGIFQNILSHLPVRFSFSATYL